MVLLLPVSGCQSEPESPDDHHRSRRHHPVWARTDAEDRLAAGARRDALGNLVLELPRVACLAENRLVGPDIPVPDASVAAALAGEPLRVSVLLGPAVFRELPLASGLRVHPAVAAEVVVPAEGRTIEAHQLVFQRQLSARCLQVLRVLQRAEQADVPRARSRLELLPVRKT